MTTLETVALHNEAWQQKQGDFSDVPLADDFEFTEPKGGEMHKLKHLLLLAGACAATLWAASASSATVTRTLLPPNEPEPFYACNFPLIASFSGTIQMTEIDKSDGTVQLLFTPVGPQAITITNPANGKSITGMGQTAGEILQITESSFVDHLNGIVLNFHLPGIGPVLQVMGNLNFSNNTFSGTHGDTTALCHYLADP
jgi:hypothetical protein